MNPETCKLFSTSGVHTSLPPCSVRAAGTTCTRIPHWRPLPPSYPLTARGGGYSRTVREVRGMKLYPSRCGFNSQPTGLNDTRRRS